VIKIAILVLLLIAAWISFRSLEPRTLYYPDRTLIAKPNIYRMAYEDVHLVAADGTKIHGWYIPVYSSVGAPGLQGARDRQRSESESPAPLRRGPDAPTLLFCHGNAGNISHRLDKLAKFNTLGLNVLIFDYRGFGQSNGHPSELGTYQDAEAAYQWLVKREALSVKRDPALSLHAPRSTSNIIFYGESLGCAVAVEMAIRHSDAAGLILESPFTSTAAMAKRIFPWLPVKWIVRYRYDNLSKIPKITMPLLILHSPQDEIVPFEMGKQLFASAPQPKQFVELVGGHNEGYELSGGRYLNAVASFLIRIAATPPASGGLR